MPSFIIVGCVWQILVRGKFLPPLPLHPWAAPKNLILSRVNIKKVFGSLLIELLKNFDCISPEQLVAKLCAYDLSLSTLKMVNDHLQNCEMGTKVGSSYGTWEDILFGLPQGSVLGPLSFSIFLCNLFAVLQHWWHHPLSSCQQYWGFIWIKWNCREGFCMVW